MKKENREENQTVAKKKKTANEDTFIKTLVMCTPKKMKKEIATYEISMTKQMPWICSRVHGSITSPVGKRVQECKRI